MNDRELMFLLVFISLSWLYQRHHSSEAVAAIMMEHRGTWKAVLPTCGMELAATESIISRSRKLTANREGVCVESVSPSGRVGKGTLVHYEYNVFYDAPKDLQKENQSLIPVQYMVEVSSPSRRSL